MRKSLLAGLIAVAFVAPVALATVEPYDLVERNLVRPAGVESSMKFVFGPFVIPPGQDINRLSIDMPIHDGFITAIAPELYDAVTGEIPPDQEMHIHHAHWFRVSDDPGDEYYTLNLAWVFGTGEEKTQGSFTSRALSQPGGPLYGIFIPGGQPQTYIYMLHNKLAEAREMFITLNVDFVYGTRESIMAAEDCGAVLLEGERCLAGADFHEMKGRLWGSTFDVPRDFGTGDGTYLYPLDIPLDDPHRRETDHLGRFFVAPHSGTLVATAGHMHPNGKMVVIANLGPAGSGCEADLDFDGFPGVTLFRSRKIDRNPLAWPYSEDFQMAASKFGFRAPVREGDRITQIAVYDNSRYAAYQAMSYVGVYVDRLEPPAPLAEDEACSPANMGPYFIGTPDGDVREGIESRQWTYLQPLCGIAELGACEGSAELPKEGVETSVVHIAGFAYVPGDRALSGPLGAPPKVRQGESLTFINEDVAGGIRHTVTTCEWPCNGEYVANYPNPDGILDSGKMGNVDYIDGGLATPEGQITIDPVYQTPTTLEPGLYSYYCRIHPTMRGVFEVIPAE